MKALILNFASFDNKSGDKSYYKFDLFDLESKQLYPMFTEQKFMSIPDGEIPSKDDQRKTFPRMADVDFVVSQYTDKEGHIVYRPQVNAILSWKKAEIK